MTTRKLLVIGAVWPEPKSSAAGKRMLQLLSLFLDLGCEITFASTASESPFSDDLPKIKRIGIALNCDSFDDFIRELKPGMVLFDRFMIEEQFGWRIAKHCPNALRILDAEDLHCLRRARQKALKNNKPFTPDGLLTEDDAKREIASILRSDLTLIISEYELDLLRTIFKVDASLLHYLPIFADELANLPTFEQRNGFVFIGNFSHAPNADAVSYLKKVIWPIIHRLDPTIPLHIYGAYPTQAILQMHNPNENFHVLGRADDALDVIKTSRVMLAPLRFGAGIKGKLLEAMQCGTPSVTTPMGSEAMNGELSWNGFISNDPQEIAEAAIELHQIKSIWEQAQHDGFEILRQRFQKNDFGADFQQRVLQLKQDLKIHRQNNFVGAMLQFHTMRSTEFLSRWISEKNK